MTGDEFAAAVLGFLGDRPVYVETGRTPCWGHDHSVGHYEMSEASQTRLKLLSEELDLGPDLICRYALGRSAPHSIMYPRVLQGIREVLYRMMNLDELV